MDKPPMLTPRGTRPICHDLTQLFLNESIEDIKKQSCYKTEDNLVLWRQRRLFRADMKDYWIDGKGISCDVLKRQLWRMTDWNSRFRPYKYKVGLFINAPVLRSLNPCRTLMVIACLLAARSAKYGFPCLLSDFQAAYPCSRSK